ncbi:MULTISPECIES: phosphopentomutase [unclassified Thioclava]|uniref:phosphopentomutase n=1 Tax=unclassified Thioclava TaxID=2621713 RepID=UPI000B538F04|nr:MULTISPECIES: phosphopentomutase [unclassified Thioclava]OWY03275.1 phosphopentomutase [Thioclava sp. IC9]OWY09600.1 phosphopentomutase [Thioclava sp. F42-5]
MSRAFLIVMDSVGIGGAPDADRFFNDGAPDTGANTVGHIAQACAEGRAEEGRSGPLKMPTLAGLGLGAAVKLASGEDAPGLMAEPVGLWGAATEVSPGKDTPSGHWELAGVPVPWEWHYFPDKENSFPPDLVAKACEIAGTDGILGNCHASGTNIIEELGDEHIRTGWPICYTSADSVFQIAAHEEHFGLDRLLKLCEGLAPTLHAMKVGRVIARPFIGENGEFTRTPNRRDYAIPAPSPTLLDWAYDAGRVTHAIGKIGDIFSHRGITHLHKGKGDADLADHLIRLTGEAEEGSLTFANFVEFDSLYGHRRDVSGYARALEWFDTVAEQFLDRLQPGDLAIFTADHGNDPSWRGTDHTRERVPVLGAGPGIGSRSVGNVGYVDLAASLATHLNIPAQGPGKSFL